MKKDLRMRIKKKSRIFLNKFLNEVEWEKEVVENKEDNWWNDKVLEV